MRSPQVGVDMAASDIDDARLSGRTLSTADVLVGDLTTAYRVQDALTARRIGRGARAVGWKLGYTSAVMRQQMGIDEPNWGPLLDSMLLEQGAMLPPGLLQPRVEPEIGLVLDRDVDTALDVGAALASCREAVVVLEVVDSVWTDYRMDLEHNTADGSSASHVVVGPALPLGVLDSVSVTLLRNGTVVGTGHGRDALGHPAAALGWLAGALAVLGRRLRAGDLVLTGGLTRAVPIEFGDVVQAELEHPDISRRRVSVRR